MKVLVTGASGFVGSQLAPALAKSHDVLAVSRQAWVWPSLAGLTARAGVALHAADSEWLALLAGQEVVVHVAGRAHVMQEQAADALAAFREVNVDATLRLATLAIQSGVKRFVFISSIKVNGESTVAGSPFSPEDAPAPVDPYGQSKLEAEIGLQALAAASGLELVIIRPTLIYGVGAKGNLALLQRIMRWPLPLPLGRICNHRSMVALDNLIDFIELAIRHPSAAGQVFLLADVAWSTPELLKIMAAASGRSLWLLPIPVSFLYQLASLVGRSAWITRLCGNLEVDSTGAHKHLGWQPPVEPAHALQRMVIADGSVTASRPATAKL